MKPLYLILTLVVLSSAQKQRKHAKQAFVASAPDSSHNQGGQYHQGGPAQHEQPAHYGGHQGSSVNYGHGKPAAPKHVYPQLLADTRTLNTDGTINFNFQADNGLQQGETVDADGTRRGFYSYPGADGKTLTVKYTAGKNGFVAEGDHLPMQPQSATHSDKDEQAYAPKTRHGRQEHDDGQYRPGTYGDDDGSSSVGNIGGGGGGRPFNRGSGGGSSGSVHQSSPYSGGNGGSSFSSFPQGGPAQTNYNQYAGVGGSPSHSSGGGGGGRPYNGGAGRFPGGGSPSYSSISGPAHGSGSGAPSYNSGAPSYNSGSSSFGGGRPGGSGFMYNNANPYQPEDGAAPFNGAFDLGNSGHFSINFNPGASQAYSPEGGFGGGGQSSSQSFGGSPGAGSSQGTGTRGQY